MPHLDNSKVKSVVVLILCSRDLHVTRCRGGCPCSWCLTQHAVDFLLHREERTNLASSRAQSGKAICANADIAQAEAQHVVCCVLHGESNKGLASPRTTKKMALLKPPTNQASHNQTDNERHYKPLHQSSDAPHTSASTPSP